jgi:hypothetical protein
VCPSPAAAGGERPPSGASSMTWRPHGFSCAAAAAAAARHEGHVSHVCTPQPGVDTEDVVARYFRYIVFIYALRYFLSFDTENSERGNTRSAPPSANSARQMAHSEPAELQGGDDTAAAKATVGSASMAFFFRPFFACLWFGRGSLLLLMMPLPDPEEEEEELRRPRQAQRETRARPSTQTSAQRNEDRITTMSESTGTTCWCCCCWFSGAGGRRVRGVASPGRACCSALCFRD